MPAVTRWAALDRSSALEGPCMAQLEDVDSIRAQCARSLREMAACLEEMVERDEMRQDAAHRRWDIDDAMRWSDALGAAQGVLDEIAGRSLRDLVSQANRAVSLLRRHRRDAQIDPLELLEAATRAGAGPLRPSEGVVSHADARSMASAAWTELRLRADEIEAPIQTLARDSFPNTTGGWWPRIRDALLGSSGWMTLDAICQAARVASGQRARIGAELNRRTLCCPPHVESRKVRDRKNRNEYRLTADGRSSPANASSTQ